MLNPKQSGGQSPHSLPVLLNEQISGSLPTIDPHRLGRLVLKRSLAENLEYSDRTEMAFYNIARKITGDENSGTHYTNDVLGCNHRCAHCWVHTEALNGQTDAAWVAHKSDLFPKRFRAARMKQRGYGQVSPSEFEKLLTGYFREQGTPILAADKRNKGRPGVVYKQRVLVRVVDDLA